MVKKHKTALLGSVRIIGGKWRGRQLKVSSMADLRPTPNRIRETLFNWLTPIIPGAHCLDAYAGSGALGFEALSRGAASVVMVDTSFEVITVLKQTVNTLKTECAEVYCADASKQLRKPVALFDIVFLDPPFQQNLLLPTCHYLENKHYLADLAYIYLETSQILKQDDLPLNWQIIKSKKTGQVAYYLAERKNKEEPR